MEVEVMEKSRKVLGEEYPNMLTGGQTGLDVQESRRVDGGGQDGCAGDRDRSAMTTC